MIMDNSDSDADFDDGHGGRSGSRRNCYHWQSFSRRWHARERAYFRQTNSRLNPSHLWKVSWTKML